MRRFGTGVWRRRQADNRQAAAATWLAVRQLVLLHAHTAHRGVAETELTRQTSGLQS